MKYNDRIICFIDILGFRDLVGNTIDSSSNDNEKEIDNLIDALNCIKRILMYDYGEFSKNKIITQFSDSVVISFDYTEESEIFYTLKDIQTVVINLALRGILCRGGITKGKIYHDENLVFGPGMNDAYILESKAANYPRIILSEEIIKLAIKYKAAHHRKDQEQRMMKEFLGKDSDGMYYIDYVEKAQGEMDDSETDYPMYLQKISEIIKKGINNKKPDIQVKYNWLKERYMIRLNEIRTHLSGKTELNDIEDNYMRLDIF
ncbi:hypothetical protein JCM14469_37410 [Desulfatiferula olefinivorans]